MFQVLLSYFFHDGSADRVPVREFLWATELVTRYYGTSLLIIPRLPFSHPDALKERKRAEYPDLRSFIRAVVVPEMQIKLKQGFGRAIRTETDTCVIAILDERSVPGQRHFEAMKAALPEVPMTSSLEDVVEFIYRVKGPDYFREGSNDQRKE